MNIPRRPILALCAAMVAIAAVPGLLQAQGAPGSRQAVPAQHFAQLPQISGARLSPDGTHLAYFRPIEGRNYLLIQELFSADPPTVVPTADALSFEWVEWANNDRLVLSMSFADKRVTTETTETRLLSTDREYTELVPLIKPGTEKVHGSRLATRDLPPPQLQDKVVDWLPDEPNHILVAVDEDHDSQYEVRRVDIRSGEHDIETAGQRGIQDWIVDQKHVIRAGTGYDLSSVVVSLQDTDGNWRRAESEDWWRQGYQPIAFSDNPAELYVLGPNEHGLRVLRVLNVDTGELGETLFGHEQVDTNGYRIHARSGQLTAVSYVDDFERHHYLDEELAKLQRSVDRVLQQTVNHLVSWSDDRRKVLVFAFNDVEPGAYYLWDRDARSLDIVATTYSQITPEMLSPVEAVSFEARDGTLIPAYLALPRDAGRSKLPTVVLPHGGPQARSDRSFRFLVQFLVSRGYAVLQPNFRGSSGYGAAYAAAGRSEWGGLMQDDVTDATRWLIEEGIADPERLCIAGWSYGGYAAAMGAVKTPELYRCAASINGVLNLPRFLADDRFYLGSRTWTEHIGLSGERASAVSPYHQADRIQVPMLIIQATDDTRVHADQGKGMVSELQRLDKPVTYVEVEFGGHSMDDEAGRLAILQALETFLDDNIGAERGGGSD